MGLTYTDVRKLLDILDRGVGLESLEVRMGDFLLKAEKSGAARPSRTGEHPDRVEQGSLGSSPNTATSEASRGHDEGAALVRAPMGGTLYRRPKPDAEPYVKEGEYVEAGQSVAVLEAMKLFSTVAAPVSGRIHRILAEDGALVQAGDVLMSIAPDSQ